MERHSKPSPDIPKWSALLVEAVNKPGMIMQAYSAFHNYSIGNQILALVQCQLRGLEPGPINTFPGWQALGRTVKRGERALILCMPITRKVRDEEAQESEGENGERTFTSFHAQGRAGSLSIKQSAKNSHRHACRNGMQSERLRHSTSNRSLSLTRTATVRDTQRSARSRSILWPNCRIRHFFMKLAHVVLGHTTEADFTDTERTPKNLREVEAEVSRFALLRSLEPRRRRLLPRLYPELAMSRDWHNGDAIPEKSAQKIFRAADQILRAGRRQANENETEH